MLVLYFSDSLRRASRSRRNHRALRLAGPYGIFEELLSASGVHNILETHLESLIAEDLDAVSLWQKSGSAVPPQSFPAL